MVVGSVTGFGFGPNLMRCISKRVNSTTPVRPNNKTAIAKAPELLQAILQESPAIKTIRREATRIVRIISKTCEAVVALLNLCFHCLTH